MRFGKINVDKLIFQCYNFYEHRTRRKITMEQLTLDKELLNEDLKEYFKKKAQKEQLESELKIINARIVETLENMSEKKYSNDEYSATVAYKESIKYSNEKALIDLLKKDDTLKYYVIESIDSKSLNDLIKTNEKVATQLKESYTKSTSSSLTVKKI